MDGFDTKKTGTLFYNRKVLHLSNTSIKRPAKRWAQKTDGGLKKVYVKALFKFIVIKVILLDKEVMHIQ